MNKLCSVVLMLGMTVTLGGCLDPVVPRLPGPGDESPNDTSQDGKTGSLIPQSAAPIV